MKSKTSYPDKTQSKITQRMTLMHAGEDGVDCTVKPETDGRDVCECIDEFGDIWRMCIVYLAPGDYRYNVIGRHGGNLPIN